MNEEEKSVNRSSPQGPGPALEPPFPEPPVMACELLAELTGRLIERMRQEGLGASDRVGQLADELLSGYSDYVCREREELGRLRQARDELESAIDRRDQFLGHILEESADAILTIDNQDRVRIWNRGAEAVFGYTREQIRGRPLSELVPASRQSELEQIRQQTRECGEVRNRFSRWRTREGKLIYVLLTSTAIRDGGGASLGSSFVIKDVTRQKEMDEAVRQAEHIASIGQLAAGLAHEIKNPLAGIGGAIEVIRERSSSEYEKDILSDVLSQVSRIDKIIRDLLNYAKPKSRQPVPLSLESLGMRLAALLRESSRSGVEFTTEGKPEDRAIVLEGDESGLEQVLLNLLLNAAQATEGKGEVRIRFLSDADWQIVRIEDTGPGVPLAIHHRIFDPFFTTKKGGTGLGLATCRRIVHEHRGSLCLDPDFQPGAAFVLKLPRRIQPHTLEEK